MAPGENEFDTPAVNNKIVLSVSRLCGHPVDSDQAKTGKRIPPARDKLAPFTGQKSMIGCPGPYISNVTVEQILTELLSCLCMTKVSMDSRYPPLLCLKIPSHPSRCGTGATFSRKPSLILPSQPSRQVLCWEAHLLCPPESAAGRHVRQLSVCLRAFRGWGACFCFPKSQHRGWHLEGSQNMARK